MKGLSSQIAVFLLMLNWVWCLTEATPDNAADDDQINPRNLQWLRQAAEDSSDDDTITPRGVKCGRVPVEERIVNGTKTGSMLYPFMVNIKSSTGHICGGAVYDKTTVITAAHCFPKEVNVNKVKLFFGDWNQRKKDDKEKKRTIKTLITHPQYKKNTMENDLAIIKLSSSLSFNTAIQPVCLPSAPVSGGETCTVIGWGDTMDTGNNKFLLEVDVNIIPKDQCSSKSWLKNKVKANMICAGYPEGQLDACQGDSGGPLVRQVDGSYELTGVVSWGVGCADAKKPGVYTDVYEYIDWIQQTAEE